MVEQAVRAPWGASGLRNRIIIRFATVALLLSILLGAITYVTVRQILLEDRQASAIQQVTQDARLLAALGSTVSNPSELLAALRPPSRSTPLLLRDGQWFAASLQVRPEDLPAELVAMVMEGRAGRQTALLTDRPVLVVGAPLGGELGSYFEVLSLVDVAATLGTLSTVLIGAGATTTLAGALLGGLIANRLLRPLRDMNRVARQIAGGELDTRLDRGLDRDLEDLVVSFNRMADSLQSRLAREARFASDVAHELRTPLTTLVTSLAVLERRGDELSSPGREALELLARDVRRLERTASDLIELAKLDAGGEEMELDVLPAGVLIGSVMGRLRRSDVDIDIDASASRSLVRFDERRLERVLSNLLDNADTHGGGVSRIALVGGGDKVQVWVEDDGPGIDPDDIDRIFERFARGLDTAPRPRGSGLGLALARENARLQGGRLWVEDRPQGGARFVLELGAEPV